MVTSPGALREGVIYDLLGRFSHEDVRTRTVFAMQQRYSVDQAIADLVSRRVGLLAEATREAWRLNDTDIDLLKWAGALHEVGVAVSQKNYSQHSAYLVLNTDLPGFSQQDQEIMAAVIAALKGKIRPEIMEPVAERKRHKVARMMALLRLAVILKHVEVLEEIPEVNVTAEDDSLVLTFPRHWGDAHPLTVWEVEQSAPTLEKIGIGMTLRPV